MTESLFGAVCLHAAVRVLRQRFISLVVVAEVQVVLENPSPERCLGEEETHILKRGTE